MGTRPAAYTILAPLIGILLLFAGPARAQEPAKPGAPSHLEVALETSRPRASAGSSFGVVAQVKNVSASRVYFKPADFIVVLPPELHNPGSGFSCCAWAGTTFVDPEIALKAGDTTRIFWTQLVRREKTPKVGLIEHLTDLVKTELYFVFFPPGDYQIAVEAKYWTDSRMQAGEYRRLTQSKVLPIAAPQFVILFGAAIGGLIAYIILAPARIRETATAAEGSLLFVRWRLVRSGATVLLGMLGSILLSTVITILLARISETQFLIQVTVNDFWGGIAIGFVASYAGTKALEKMLGPRSANGGRQTLATSGTNAQPGSTT